MGSRAVVEIRKLRFLYHICFVNGKSFVLGCIFSYFYALIFLNGLNFIQESKVNNIRGT